MNPGADDHLIPAKVLLRVRPMVTAGLAKLVDEVNQYAAPMYPATANGAADARPERTTPRMTMSRPNVATTSPTHSPLVDRAWVERLMGSRSNMMLAITAPTQPPAIWAGM